MIDRHAHFTGSLPLAFVEKRARCEGRYEQLHAELINLAKEVDPGAATNLANLVSLVRSARAGLDYGWFFGLYGAVQRAIRPARATDVEWYLFYRSGFDAILRSRQEEGIGGVDLFVSVGQSIDLLDIKLRALRDARAAAPATQVTVRLTLSRTSALRSPEGSQVLDALFIRLSTSREDYECVAGMDISGDESIGRWHEARAALVEMVAFRSRAKRPLAVSLHLGEDLVSLTAPELLDRFEQVLSLGVDAIGHGLFAWVPERRLAESQAHRHLIGFANERQSLLRSMRSHSTRLELCPTTMLVTQLSLQRLDLPTRLPEDARPTIVIGTDSPALLGTTLANEHILAGATARAHVAS